MLRISLAAAALILASCGAGAQQYPSRLLEMIIPFTAGSGLDVNGRAVAAALSDHLKQSVVVLNREGAAGTIGFGALALANPDGYVIGFGPTTPISSAPFIVKGVRYNADSFSYICQIFETVFVVAVGPNSKFKTVQELFAAARARPGTLTYGTAGLGSIPHLSVANMERALGLSFQHVPYRGDGALLPALLRSETDFAVVAVATARPQPGVRALAVFSDERHAAYPDVPNIKELGVGRSVPPGQVGLYAPKGLSPNVQQVLESGCAAAVKAPEVQRVMSTTGQIPKYLTGAQYRAQTVEDYAFKAELIRGLGIGN